MYETRPSRLTESLLSKRRKRRSFGRSCCCVAAAVAESLKVCEMRHSLVWLQVRVVRGVCLILYDFVVDAISENIVADVV